MSFIKKLQFFNLKTVVVSGATAFSILVLNGCSQPTPFAIVEPSDSVAQAATAPKSTTLKILSLLITASSTPGRRIRPERSYFESRFW